jgi:hypothetical protein
MAAAGSRTCMKTDAAVAITAVTVAASDVSADVSLWRITHSCQLRTACSFAATAASVCSAAVTAQLSSAQYCCAAARNKAVLPHVSNHWMARHCFNCLDYRHCRGNSPIFPRGRLLPPPEISLGKKGGSSTRPRQHQQ